MTAIAGTRPRTPSKATHALDEIVTIEIRHGDIGDEQIERRRRQRDECCVRRGTLQHRCSPLVEHADQQFARILQVVHDEDLEAGQIDDKLREYRNVRLVRRPRRAAGGCGTVVPWPAPSLVA